MNETMKSESKMEKPDAVSIAEAARRIGVSRRSVERGIAAGHIKAFWMGGRHLVPRSELVRIFAPMGAVA